MIRPLESLISTGLRGRLLDHPLRFVARELARQRVVCTYRLRETGVWLCLEHNTPDVLVLDEIFYQRLYEPPPEVERLLRGPIRALDVGANIGMFGAWFIGRYPRGEVISVEPDARNAKLLRRAIEANDAGQRWCMVQAAVATKPGTLRFAGSEFATSHVVDDPGAPAVASVDFFDQASTADLLKVDIEGSEWEILSDARMADLPARALVLEYHPDRCATSDSHACAVDLIRAAGFSSRPIFRAATGVGMLWAWRAPGEPPPP